MPKDIPPLAGWPTQTSFVHEEKGRAKKPTRYMRGSRRRPLRRMKDDHSPSVGG